MNSALKILYTGLLISTAPAVLAQQSEKGTAAKASLSAKKIENRPWIKKYIAITAGFPFGEFSTTHFFSMGASYAITLNQENDLFNWAFDAGATYYFGKKETTNQYSYKYPGFTFIHMMGGTHFWIWDFNVRLLAGPALGIYNGKTKFDIGASLEGTYSLGRQFTIAPELLMVKESKSDPLWAGSLKLGYLF